MSDLITFHKYFVAERILSLQKLQDMALGNIDQILYYAEFRHSCYNSAVTRPRLMKIIDSEAVMRMNIEIRKKACFKIIKCNKSDYFWVLSCPFG